MVVHESAGGASRLKLITNSSFPRLISVEKFGGEGMAFSKEIRPSL